MSRRSNTRLASLSVNIGISHECFTASWSVPYLLPLSECIIPTGQHWALHFSQSSQASTRLFRCLDWSLALNSDCGTLGSRLWWPQQWNGIIWDAQTNQPTNQPVDTKLQSNYRIKSKKLMYVQVELYVVCVNQLSFLVGGVFTYLAKLPMLGDSCGTRLAYLTSLLEVCSRSSLLDRCDVHAYMCTCYRWNEIMITNLQAGHPLSISTCYIVIFSNIWLSTWQLLYDFCRWLLSTMLRRCVNYYYMYCKHASKHPWTLEIHR